MSHISRSWRAMSAPSASTHGAAGWVGGRWAPGLAAVAVWLAAGGAAAYGVLHALGQGPAVSVPVAAAAAPVADVQAVARALGARSALPVSAPGPLSPDMGGRYTLQGVVASASGPGVALIAVEGQRALPYRVGSVVDGRWWVQSVGRRTVTLVLVSAGQALAPDETSAGGITLALPVQPSVSLGIQAAGS